MSYAKRNYGKITNRPSGGGNKLQGLPPVATQHYIPPNGNNKFSIKASSNDRTKIFIQNMLGGIGNRYNSQFGPTADGLTPSSLDTNDTNDTNPIPIHTYSKSDLHSLSFNYQNLIHIIGSVDAPPQYPINVYKYSVPVKITDDATSTQYDNTSILYVYKPVGANTSDNLLVLHGAGNAYEMDPQSDFNTFLSPYNHATLAYMASATGHTVRYPLYPGFGAHEHTGHFDSDEPEDWFPKTMALDDFIGQNLSIYAGSMGTSVANLLVKKKLLDDYLIKKVYLGGPALVRSLLYDDSWSGMKGYPVLIKPPTLINPISDISNVITWITNFNSSVSPLYSLLRYTAGQLAPQLDAMDLSFTNIMSTKDPPLPYTWHKVFNAFFKIYLALSYNHYPFAYHSTLSQITLGVKYGIDSWYNSMTPEAKSIFKTSQSSNATIQQLSNLYQYGNTAGTGTAYVPAPVSPAQVLDISGLTRIVSDDTATYGSMLESFELSMNNLHQDVSINIFYDISDSVTPFYKNAIFDSSFSTDLSNNVTKYFIDNSFSSVVDNSLLPYSNYLSNQLSVPLDPHTKAVTEPLFHFIADNKV